MVRDPNRLRGRPWQGEVEVVAGDVLDPEGLSAAMSGVTVAYYLIHSMGAGADFHERDLRAARSFAAAAEAAGVSRIIYLGGLADETAGLSEHLRSRQQTGGALGTTGVPVTEFRAGVIVGSGSLSFEVIRYLVERVPVMICPRWVYTKTQPIGIREVVQYLAAALEVPASEGRIIEIGGRDVISYGEMMTQYAEVRGLRRLMLPVPVLTPRLSSYWVDLVTPIPAAVARPLIEGLRNESVVHDSSGQRLFGDIAPVDYRTAVERALASLDAHGVETAWSDALSTSQGDHLPVILTTQEGMIVERRQYRTAATVAAVFGVFSGLGGRRGWLYLNWTWRLRGFLDRLVGGVGLRRGRRDPDLLRVGDALDFWRVESVDPDRRLLLRAEMKVPGAAWLEFVVSGEGEGSRLSQTAFFAPKGLFGWIYWYGLYPLHAVIFSGLIRRIGEEALSVSARAQPTHGPGGH
jgi:uncharacterized protein YbjT (DUF2867 family)